MTPWRLINKVKRYRKYRKYLAIRINDKSCTYFGDINNKRIGMIDDTNPPTFLTMIKIKKRLANHLYLYEKLAGTPQGEVEVLASGARKKHPKSTLRKVQA